MSNTEESRKREEGEHPEIDRAYERQDGGQLPSDQDDAGYSGPDPQDDEPGDGADEDQGN
jgi:hypothetical protein